MQFGGVQIEKTDNGFHIHQTSYLTKLRSFSETANYSDYRSLRAKLVSASKSRPDISCSTAKSVGVVGIQGARLEVDGWKKLS